MRIGPALLHTIRGITLGDEDAERRYIEGIRENPGRLENSISRYIGPFQFSRQTWDTIRPYLNIGNSYELMFVYKGIKFREIVVEDACDQHMQCDVPQSVITSWMGKSPYEIFDISRDTPLGWPKNAKINHSCFTNEERYIVITIPIIP